ncbi:HlyD family secretion protein, partial [Klebsiella quasipneumoniae]
PEVEPTFSWVRLAQRVPVRIHIDTLPEGVERVAGLSATVSVIPARLARRAGKSSPAGANQAQ